jgi:hypothetical protein
VEDRFHAEFLRQGQTFPIPFGDVEEDRRAFGGFPAATEQPRRQGTILREQRTDPSAHATASRDRITTQRPVFQRRERAARRLSDALPGVRGSAGDLRHEAEAQGFDQPV